MLRPAPSPPCRPSCVPGGTCSSTGTRRSRPEEEEESAAVRYDASGRALAGLVIQWQGGELVIMDTASLASSITTPSRATCLFSSIPRSSRCGTTGPVLIRSQQSGNHHGRSVIIHHAADNASKSATRVNRTLALPGLPPCLVCCLAPLFLSLSLSPVTWWGSTTAVVLSSRSHA